MYKYEVNRWLAKDKDDGQIERELSLSKSSLCKLLFDNANLFRRNNFIPKACESC
jgi:hypothetical protein